MTNQIWENFVQYMYVLRMNTQTNNISFLIWIGMYYVLKSFEKVGLSQLLL